MKETAVKMRSPATGIESLETAPITEFQKLSWKYVGVRSLRQQLILEVASRFRQCRGLAEDPATIAITFQANLTNQLASFEDPTLVVTSGAPLSPALSSCILRLFETPLALKPEGEGRLPEYQGTAEVRLNFGVGADRGMKSD